MSDTILIAYDGSEDARAAVQEAGRLFKGHDAQVLTVWESARGLAGGARAVLPGAVVQDAMAALDEAALEEAVRTAAEGAVLGKESGLHAVGRAAKAGRNTWSTIVAEAELQEAAVLVVGTRGRSPLKAAVLGSVSSAAAASCLRPVLVVRAAAASSEAAPAEAGAAGQDA
jgi:nucleotide-binding universal stress UspA family protein